MNDPANDAVPFKVAQLLDQHLLGDARDGPFKLAKPKGAPAKELKKNSELPASLEHFQRLLDPGGGHPWCDPRIHTFLRVLLIFGGSGHCPRIAQIAAPCIAGSLALAVCLSGTYFLVSTILISWFFPYGRQSTYSSQFLAFAGR